MKRMRPNIQPIRWAIVPNYRTAAILRCVGITTDDVDGVLTLNG